MKVIKGINKGERKHSGHKKYIKALEEYIYKLEKDNKTFLEAIEKCQEAIEEHQNRVSEFLTFIKPTIEAFEKQRGKLKELGFNSVEELETGLIDLDNFLTPLLPDFKQGLKYNRKYNPIKTGSIQENDFKEWAELNRDLILKRAKAGKKGYRSDLHKLASIEIPSSTFYRHLKNFLKNNLK